MVEDLNTLKSKRKQVKASSTRFANYLNTLDQDNLNIGTLKLRRNNFVELLHKFDEIQSSIELLDETEFENNEREDFEAIYFELLRKGNEIISKHENLADDTPSSHSNSMAPRVRLPKIDLPKFQGSYEDWYNFRDTFNSLIHSSNVLSAIEKFNYLKSSLSGEAAGILQSLEITEANYNSAWNMLNDRYENKRLIIKKHIHAIHELPACNKENYHSLRIILDGVLKHIRALNSLQRPTEQWDDLLTYIITAKLDPATNKAWEASLDRKTIPTFKDLTDFLDHRCQILDAITKTQNLSLVPSHKFNQKIASNVATFNTSCPICNANHAIYQCDKFLQSTQEQRFQTIKRKNLCINCLRSSHPVDKCTLGPCKKCRKRHNTLLHREQTPPKPIQTAPECNANSVTTSYCGTLQTTKEYLLATAQIIVYDTNGNSHHCRAMLDSGSQSCFVTQELLNKLKIQKVAENVTITGINQTASNTMFSASIKIQSRFNIYNKVIKCYILNEIAEAMPSKTFCKSIIKIPQYIKLADPEFNKSAKIDLLIGVELVWDIMCVGSIKNGKNMPILQKTHFGWIVAGVIITNNANCNNHTACFASIQSKLDSDLTKFWQLEEYSSQQALNSEEKECEAIFTETYQRNEEGRFVVRLPLKTQVVPRIGESYQSAEKRFYALERKLDKNPKLKQDYSNFMREYLDLGHMKLSDQSKPNQTIIYLPHHGVIKQNSTTTKLRVVFDGSAKTSTGISLNDTLMVGPTLQDDLVSILLRFRTHRFVITADITKMYRQILIANDQTSFQRILWRENKQEMLKAFDLTTVTYGTASASYLAIRSLQQLAENEEHNFPVGSKIARRDFYVDDLLTGSNELNEAATIINEVDKLLQAGGFLLRKWVSNVPHLVQQLEHDSNERIINLDKQESTNTLGLQWNPSSDTFQFSVPVFPHTDKITKRTILSNISQLFDPLGLLAPIIITGKLLMQKLWQLELNWDESVPTDIHTTWFQFKKQLTEIHQIRVPRWIINSTNPTEIQLHGFCDASEAAYGACIYVRISSGQTHYTTLICAKSRVAPIKNISLPRLELCGALLLARLLNKVIISLNLSTSKKYCWTDSTIVQAWVNTNSRNWKTFVANRVSEIQDLTKLVEWRHVSTNDNPADMISRGISPLELINSKLWWYGPNWLQAESTEWPESTIPKTSNISLPEQRIIATPAIIEQKTTNIFSNFSNFNKMVRILAYCSRFVSNIRNKIKNTTMTTGPLTNSELNDTITCIIRKIQHDSFIIDIKHLNSHGCVNRKSKLLSLNPFLDQEKIIRVGGRLRNANIPYNCKHQILLPKGHVTNLIIEQYHVNHLHAGVQNTLAAIRASYWLTSGKSVVKNIITKCIICFRAKPLPAQHIMGNLPISRVMPARPFTNCGVDYFGPLQIREGKRRNSKMTKGYGAVFVCMATKAIHLEVASDLSAEVFLAALKRFISRRGKPSNIYSDNATNFIGANNELRRLYDLFHEENSKTRIITAMQQEQISWHFIPPRSPHFGGIWEAAVKSVKYHLTRIVGNASLTFEETNTIFTQVEAVLNSRPLTPLTNDPNDLSYLTPGHFLIGDSLKGPCEPELLTVPVNRLSRWQHLERLRQQFWHQWHREYLATLQPRKKWQTATSNLQLGQMVLLRDDNIPPMQWHIGRIEEVHQGTDGVVRAATIKTSKGSFKRAATKLCPLPSDKF